MSKSIAVFGAGPGLGQAVARRYAREGYAVTDLDRQLRHRGTSPGSEPAPHQPE